MLAGAVTVALWALAAFLMLRWIRVATFRPDPEAPARARLRRELAALGPCGRRGHASTCTCDRGDAVVVHVRRRPEGDA